MAIFLDEVKPLTIYRGKYRFPIDRKDRLKNSLVYLMTSSFNNTIRFLCANNLAKDNSQNFTSYFLEKNVQFIIENTVNESNLLINGEPIDFTYELVEDLSLINSDNVSLNETMFMTNEENTKYRMLFGDDVEEILNEDLSKTKRGTYNFNAIFKSMLYEHRLKNQSDVLKLYEELKKKVEVITNTFVNPDLYKNRNLYYDWSYYTEVFFNDKKVPLGDRGLDIFAAFIDRFLGDRRFDSYEKKVIVIPMNDWIEERDDPFDFTTNLNPIVLLYRSLKIKELERFKNWNNCLIVITKGNSFFTLKTDSIDGVGDINKLGSCINRLHQQDLKNTEEISKDSSLVILNHLADKMSSSGIKINNITGGTSTLTKENIEDDETEIDDSDPEVKKAMLVNKLSKVAEKNTTVDNAINDLDTALDKEDTEKMKDLLLDIQSDSGIKMNKARAQRHEKMQEELLKKEVHGKTVKQLLEQFKKNDSIPETSIPVDSIDDHWKKVKFVNFSSTYTKQDMEADIVAMFYHFTKVTHPMNILKMDVENTSTSEDYINTYTVDYEDAESGKRSTIKVDIPIMVGDRFMKLRGNEKVLIGQLLLLPIVKTDEDTVQIVSNYNKIFISRKSPSGVGKSTPIINKMIKIFNKYGGKEFKVIPGDNRKVCAFYALPISFIDLASLYSSITFPDGSYVSFNMDKLKEIDFDRSYLSKADAKLTNEALMNKYMAIYVKNNKKIPIIDQSVDEYLLDLMCSYSKDFVELYNVTPISKRLMFTEASILNMKIPVIVMVAYSIGLQATLNTIGIKYEFTEVRPRKGENYVKFNDGYLKYEPRSDADNLLMNGLMQVDTENYSIKEINTKDMWLSVLDEYGGRVKADGLDNFYDLMMDPITVEVCQTLHIPHTYIEALLYASSLLTDSKYNRHTDITGNRLRINEVIVGHLYSVLAKEYGAYRNTVKRNKGSVAFTCKRSAVIDSILTHDQTSSDLSTMTPLLEAENANKVTFKGLSGLNSERAFSIEKRAYDESMLGVVGMSTGFSGTVGINRQLSIDSGIVNKRGFIAPKKPEELDNLSTLSVMEAMSPLAINRDDPIRTAMAFTQTVQHMMTVRKAMPQLVTCGADEALPYITSNKFSYKFKGKKGTILEVTDDYVVIQDDETKECDYVDLRELVQKNSDGGFYLTTKLDINKGIKKGSKVKHNDIIAYNKLNYSPSIGNNRTSADPNSISYNIGSMAKIGILHTAMGFEDSTVVDWVLSNALSTNLVLQKEVSLLPSANVYNMVEVGSPIEEGEPLIIFSDSFEDEDANALLRNLAKDNPIVSDIGRKQVHSKASGKIQDIKIYRTVEMDKLSPSLQTIIKKYENKIDKLKKVMRAHKINKEFELEATTKLPMEGKLKNVEGVLIEFYISTIDKFGVGDKLTFANGLKGVCSAIIPPGKEAFTPYRQNEFVSAFLTATGVVKRMVVSCLLNGYINKGLIELSRQVQDELGIKWRPIQEILIEGLEIV